MLLAVNLFPSIPDNAKTCLIQRANASVEMEQCDFMNVSNNFVLERRAFLSSF